MAYRVHVYMVYLTYKGKLYGVRVNDVYCKTSQFCFGNFRNSQTSIERNYNVTFDKLIILFATILLQPKMVNYGKQLFHDSLRWNENCNENTEKVNSENWHLAYIEKKRMS